MQQQSNRIQKAEPSGTSIRDYIKAMQPAKNDLLNFLTDGKFTQAEICNRLGKSRSTVSRQIHQLEAAVLVEKMPDGKRKAKEDK